MTDNTVSVDIARTRSVAVTLGICLILGLSTACTTPEETGVASSTALQQEQSGETQASKPAQETSSQPIDNNADASRPEFSIPDEVITRISEAISADLNQPTTSLTVEQVSAETWQDGCLGLSSQEELCTMALVDGWRIQVHDGIDTFTYRTDIDGTQVRREPES